jgi:hypothetical protein
MIQKLRTKGIRKTGGGIFHDTRADVNVLMKVCNELINKVDELTDEVNKLKGEKK